MPRTTQAARLAALEAKFDKLIDVIVQDRERAFQQATAPVVAAPVQAEANAPLYVSDKAPCALHEGCTRKLSNPAGAHEPCTGKGDPMHDKLRASHRHF